MTHDDLVSGFASAGIRPGMVLTVHSSLSSLGHIEGGAPVVVEALHQAVGDQGTIQFPMLTFHGSLTKYLRQRPHVDLRTAEISTGAIPRAARDHPLAKKSIHPTHPVAAIGPAATELLSGPQNAEGPCGIHSPFYKATMMDGNILLIGVTNQANTTLHCVEELAAPYIWGDLYNVPFIDWHGRPRQMQVRGYIASLPRRFDTINTRLLELGMMTEHPLGPATLRLIHARRLIETVTEWVKKEPYLLAERE